MPLQQPQPPAPRVILEALPAGQGGMLVSLVPLVPTPRAPQPVVLAAQEAIL